jgi:hypothetical protein
MQHPVLLQDLARCFAQDAARRAPNTSYRTPRLTIRTRRPLRWRSRTRLALADSRGIRS